MNWCKATVVSVSQKWMASLTDRKKKENLVKKDFSAEWLPFFSPPQFCITQTHKIQFRTSGQWNLRKGCLAIILECLFVLLLKEHCRQKSIYLEMWGLWLSICSICCCVCSQVSGYFAMVQSKCEPGLVLVGFTHIGYCHSGQVFLAKQCGKQDAMRRPSQLVMPSLKQTAV